MKRFKKRHLTAPECEALAQSAEGSSPLRQPLSQGRGRGGGNRGLHPTQGTRTHPRGPGRQRNILDFFGKRQEKQQVGAAGMRSCGIKEEPLDPFFPGSSDSFRDTRDTSSNSSLCLDDQDFVAAPRGHSRKRALPTAASGVPKEEQDPWGEPDKKIPDLSRIKQECEDLEVEPLPDTHYGLLGTRNWEVPQGTMEDLPAEVLRNIFAFLPVPDLYQNLSLVCHSWREIIRDPLFIPWKKLYQRYLMKEDTALRRVEQILQEFSITKEQEGCVLGLIRLVSSTATGPKVDPSAVLRSLGSHPLFPKAQVCVLHKFPDLKSKAGPEKMWAILAVMVLFSDGVGDIRRLLECLRSPRSELSVVEVTEVLYCMATLLFAMRDRGIPITNRIHYNLFYCLYLMENASGIVQPLEEGRVASSGCQTVSDVSGVRLTHEQQRILNHKIEPGQTVKIMAFAGTGKTSTLVKYAEKFPELKFLYVAFNKAVAEKGKNVFPRNVTCKTFHSLAFGSIGRHYKDKGKLNFSKMSAFSISFLLRNRKEQSLFVRGKTVSQTLENFFSSPDEEICEEHTPVWFKNTHGRMQLMSQQEKQINVEEAKEIWHNMKKLDGDAEKRYKMTCDGYLKLWQLSKPQLSGYDAIFVDEAQDCTPAIVDIVQSQKCGKILVGDPHQQIYTFRGAVNTLYALPHTHVYYLTQGLARFGLSRIYDIWKLSQPADIRQNSNLVINDSFIKKWEETEGFIGLKEYAEHVDDRELQLKISIVEKHRERIPELVQRIQGSHVSRESLADFLIGTVHQAKGLEFDTVCIADDFVQIPSVSGAFLRGMNIIPGRTPEDEWNLLYVAVTRAKKCLLMSKSLENLLMLAGERFLRVELLSEAGKDEGRAPITCCISGCAKSLEFSSGLVVKKLPLTHSDGSRDPGGFLCQACTWQCFGSLAPLTSFPTIREEPGQL
uniref:F-box DNA helicase 1 n=1 Tax=Corvus moneduloides TaxID=1196302 RepID=A0A8U7M7U6_CORMO